MYEENPTQDIPVFLQPFTVNLEALELCARTFLWKSELRFGRWRFKRWDIKIGSIVFTLTSANTERTLFHEQQRLVTWKQWSTKVNLETIASSLPWYKISPFSGYYPWETPKFIGDEEEICESFQSRRRSQKLFIWTIYENLAHLVKNYHGIIGQLFLIDKRQEIAERAVRRVKEGNISCIIAIWIEW